MPASARGDEIVECVHLRGVETLRAICSRTKWLRTLTASGRNFDTVLGDLCGDYAGVQIED